MKFLFIFAHPDDETVACGGTMQLLAHQGHTVELVSATDGGAGEVKPKFNGTYTKVSDLRRQELINAAQVLGVSRTTILEFQDGEIRNQDVWGKLLISIIEVIDSSKPDVIVTFDHSGWYFHLDHVGVSISTTLAVQQAKHQVAAFFHAFFKVDGQSRWKYVFPQQLDVTHRVNVETVKSTKLKALAAHASQNLRDPKKVVKNQQPHYELFQLVNATKLGQTWLDKQTIFETIAGE